MPGPPGAFQMMGNFQLVNNFQVLLTVTRNGCCVALLPCDWLGGPQWSWLGPLPDSRLACRERWLSPGLGDWSSRKNPARALRGVWHFSPGTAGPEGAGELEMFGVQRKKKLG